MTSSRILRSSLAAMALFGALQAAAHAQTVDRTKRPTVPPSPSLKFPEPQRFTLANGIPVYYLEDHSLPVVSANALVDINWSALQTNGALGGIMNLMLREGTTTRTADQQSEAQAELGNNVAPTGFYTIRQNVPKSLELMADMLRNPAFPEAALSRVKANQMTTVRRNRENPNFLANRVYSNVVYGVDHPYARTATEEGITAINRDTLLAYHRRFFGAPNVSIVIAGDLTRAEAAEWLGKAFGDWKPVENATVSMPRAKGFTGRAIYLYDRPSSPQSVILAGNLGPNRESPQYFAAELLNTALGGAFASRINLNLREQRQFTYGANSGFLWRRTGEPSNFIVSTSVSTPKTDSAVMEVMKEITGIRGPRPLTAEELNFALRSQVSSLPMRFETMSARAGAVSSMLSERLPLDWYSQLVQRYRAVDLNAARAAANLIDPDNMIIVIVGDRKAIEAGLRATGIAPVIVVDEKGQPKA